MVLYLLHLHHFKFSPPFTLVRFIHPDYKGLYRILGLKNDASQVEIKDAYYKLSKQYHPDRSSDTQSHKKFLEISAAYEVLGNTLSRRRYDLGVFQDLNIDSGDVDHLKHSLKRYQQRHRFRYRSNVPPPTGRTKFYNYDEFYRMHYGDKNQKGSNSNFAWEEDFYFDNPLGVYKKRHEVLLMKFREDNKLDSRKQKRNSLTADKLNTPNEKEWRDIRRSAETNEKYELVINSITFMSICTVIAAYYIYML